MLLLYADVPQSHVSSFCKVSQDEIDDIVLTGIEVQ